jgi:hypothetical protein
MNQESLFFVASMQGLFSAKIGFMKRLILIITMILLLAACGSDNTVRTLEANHMLAGTQIADLRITATVQAARAQTTLDFMQTRAAFAAIQSGLLESTLAADGTDMPYIETQRAIILGSSPTPSMAPVLAAEATEGVDSPTFTPVSETPTPTIPGVTPIFPTASKTATLPPDPNALRIENPITALAAGSDGCGANITSAFTVNTEEIYIIIKAYNLRAREVTFSSHWTYEGQAIGPVFEYTPERNYDELCIWFFVDQTDFEFLAGDYTVGIDIDGAPVFAPLAFNISE